MDFNEERWMESDNKAYVWIAAWSIFIFEVSRAAIVALYSSRTNLQTDIWKSFQNFHALPHRTMDANSAL